MRYQVDVTFRKKDGSEVHTAYPIEFPDDETSDAWFEALEEIAAEGDVEVGGGLSLLKENEDGYFWLPETTQADH